MLNIRIFNTVFTFGSIPKYIGSLADSQNVQHPFPTMLSCIWGAHTSGSTNNPIRNINVFKTDIFNTFYRAVKSKKSSLPSLNPSDARQLSFLVWEKAAMKKALNAILFVAAAWALNTGTHSFKEAEGGGRLARWIHLCGPVNTNSSFEKYGKTSDGTKKLAIISNDFFL